MKVFKASIMAQMLNLASEKKKNIDIAHENDSYFIRECMAEYTAVIECLAIVANCSKKEAAEKVCYWEKALH